MKFSKNPPDSLAEYITEHYGQCTSDMVCKCLKTGWLGTGCPNWKPVKAKNWAELAVEVTTN